MDEQAEGYDREADDYSPTEKRKHKGLQHLRLLDPAIPSAELTLLLKNVRLIHLPES